MTIRDRLVHAQQLRSAGRLAEAEQAVRAVLAEHPNDGGALHALGLLAEQAGQLAMARDLINRAATNNPASGRMVNDLGRVIARLGEVRVAAKCFERAAELLPDDAEVNNNLGNTLHGSHRLPEALARFDKAIALNPAYPEAHYNRANTLRDMLRLNDAIGAYERAIALRPQLLEAYNNLGNILSEQEKHNEAMEWYRRALAIKPNYAKAYNNLGKALRELGQTVEALAAYEQALKIQPDYAKALSNRGVIFKDMGRMGEATVSFQAALAIEPELADALNNLCGLLREEGRIDQVINVCERAISRNPKYAEAYNCLGSALTESSQLEKAMAACEKAIALKPDLAEAHNNIGNILREQGELDEAIERYRQAVLAKPTSVEIGSNLAYTVQFSSRFDSRAILKENLEWAQRHEKPVTALTQWLNDRNPHRRLRIGYVSPDFRQHCAACFMLPVFKGHDAKKVEVFCYSGAKKPDAITEKFKALAHVFHATSGWSDDKLARQIQDDQIDVLVDLTLHMASSRLRMFARKPAPVQITWLGYPGTTGMGRIDYRLTDPYLDPPGQGDEFYSEKSIRLPETFWCYEPLVETADVNGLPALQNGYTTFGCFNNFVKVTGETLDLWARTMLAVPKSRMIIMSQPGPHRARVLARFQSGGVDPGRIEFVGRTPMEEYFKLYHRVDLSLDTIPYNGHTTTLDGLWMGVPVVSVAGDTAPARGGVSILSNIALNDYIARDADEFVELGAAKARALNELGATRASLRDRMHRSVLTDGRRFALHLESVYGDVFAKWAASLP